MWAINMKLSIIITTFNRPDSLKRCVDAIRDLSLSIPHEVVVSDDASNEKNLDQIKQLSGIDNLILSDVNQGLGANLNKAIRAAKGEFIVYCQDDFVLDKNIEPILLEGMQAIENKKLDMIRFTSNYSFPKLIPFSENIKRIPHFSWQNFFYNTYQYSDHPFLSKKSFFVELNYFLEGVKGDYGENEFAIRVLNFHKRIGITDKKWVHKDAEAKSVIRSVPSAPTKQKPTKKARKLLRAFRLHFEWICYRKNKRKLITY